MKKLNVLIFGASRGTGRELVAQARDQGHHVTAFARNPPQELVEDTRIKVLRGDLLDATAVARAISGQDVIFSTVGNAPGDARKPTTLFSEGMRHIVAGARAAGVQRITYSTIFSLLQNHRVIPMTRRYLPESVSGVKYIIPLKKPTLRKNPRNRNARPTFKVAAQVSRRLTDETLHATIWNARKLAARVSEPGREHSVGLTGAPKADPLPPTSFRAAGNGFRTQRRATSRQQKPLS